jgi:hypothetical protein
VGDVAATHDLRVTTPEAAALGEDLTLRAELGGPGWQAPVAATVALPAGDAPGERWLPFVIASGGQTNVWGLARARVGEAVRLTRALEFTASNRLTAVVANVSTGRACVISAATATVAGLPSIAPLTNLALPPGASQRLEFAVAGVAPFAIYTTRVAVALSDGRAPQARRLTGYHPLTRRTVRVDGALNDWDGVPALNLATARFRKLRADWQGPEDLSGTLRICADATNFYLAAEIRDNVFCQTYAGWDAWKGDNLQLGLSPLTPWDSREAGDQRQEIGLSLTAHGPECYRSAGDGEKGVLTNVTLVARRAGGATIYECAIPWRELPGMGPARSVFGFGLFVNDNDGDGRRGYLEWGDIKNVGDMRALRWE